MENIRLKDFLEYKFLNGIKMSPDKKSCIFGVVTCDEENNGYHHNIYIRRDGQCMSLTGSDKDSGAVYLDNDTVLFRSSRDKDVQEKIKNGEEWTSFYKISLGGGEAQKFFDIPLMVSQIEKLDEEHFLLSASYNLDFSVFGREDQKDALLKAKKASADYEVFTTIPFCHNGGGFVKNTISRLYIYSVKSDELTCISPDGLNVASFNIKEDKKEAVIIAVKSSKRPATRSGVYTYDFENKVWSERVKEDLYDFGAAFYFGSNILLIGNKEWQHGRNQNDRFFLLDHDNNVSLFYDNEESLWNSVGSDCRFGGGCQMKVSGDKFYFISTRIKDSVVLSIDLKGNVKEEIAYEGSVDCFDVCDGLLYYIGMKDGRLQEVYKKEFLNDAVVSDEKMTALNEAVHENKYVASYNEVCFENDGIDFTGWVLLPKDYDPDKKYPAILDIHGGPKTVYGKVFYHEMQLWANMGYFVFFTNPRGSDGRGNEFMDIFGKYGTIDYDDLMKFTDTVLEKYPAIDKERVGVTGGSYGGFMTNWIIGHTSRFACAATQRSISNWISFYGTSDIGMFFAEDQIHGNIFESPQKLWEHSPLKYAENIKTPTLFIHSDEDYRCPLEQGLQLYTAMVDRGVEARFVLFHGENHELSRGGKPKHRVRRLEEITDWMEKYLKEL